MAGWVEQQQRVQSSRAALETYGQRPDGVDCQLVSLIVAHLCGV